MSCVEKEILQSFRDKYPFAKSIDPGQLLALADQYSKELCEGTWGCNYQHAIELLIAHDLRVRDNDCLTVAGAAKSLETGKSLKLDLNNCQCTEWLNQSIYGQAFLRLRDQAVGVGFMVIC